MTTQARYFAEFYTSRNTASLPVPVSELPTTLAHARSATARKAAAIGCVKFTLRPSAGYVAPFEHWERAEDGRAWERTEWSDTADMRVLSLPATA